MFDRIKRLGAETAVYGVSTILGRFLTFLLTPLYANVLPPADLGMVATVFAYIAFLNVLYNYGMDSAFMKHVSLSDGKDEESPESNDHSSRTVAPHGKRAKEVFTTAFISVLGTSFLFSAFIVLSASLLTNVIHVPESHGAIIPYAAAILFLDAVTLVPFASLRMEGKARRFAAIRIAGIAANVVCTVLFLVRDNMGIDGIFLAGVISSALTVVLLIPTIGKNLHFTFPPGLYRALVSFGLPMVPAGLAGMAIQVIDRPILEALTDKATVGIYQANYRLGIFMMLVVSMIDFAWKPFFFNHSNDPDARKIFARVLTYVVLLMAILFVILGLFLEDIVTAPLFLGYSILPEAYWVGMSIIPIVMLGYMFLGVAGIFSAGLYITKKTSMLPLATFTGAAVNIGANFLFIPMFGIMGAAVATLLSYAAMAAMMYTMSARVYSVQYEFGRILKIGGAVAIVFLLHALLLPLDIALVGKFFLVILFGGLMVIMKFGDPSEIAALRKMFMSGKSSPQPLDDQSL